ALGPIRYLINFTDGGVAVSDDLQVLGQGGQPVPGLYAAGLSGMGGVLLEGHGHHLGWAFTSGRLAGRRAAYNVVTSDLPEAAGAQPAAH
ncbi:MAG TPA: FAD-binding protein, partial [Ramlibacter sp.]|nr:FAD-binding protein [Ramlibacter sp.]